MQLSVKMEDIVTAKHFHPSPSARPLAETLSKHNVDPNTLIRCELMQCTLLKTACAARWRAANSIDRMPAYRKASSPSVDNFGMCKNCETGKALNEGREPKTRQKITWEKIKLAEKKEVLCNVYWKNPAIKNKNGKPNAHDMCRECFGLKVKARKEEQRKMEEDAKTKKAPGLLLDFKGMETLFDKLKERAKEELRDPDKQALWLLKGLLVD